MFNSENAKRLYIQFCVDLLYHGNATMETLPDYAGNFGLVPASVVADEIRNLLTRWQSKRGL